MIMPGIQETSRAEHLEWCKKRARDYLDAGDSDQAFASMGPDLNRHDGTRNHSGMELGMMLRMSGGLSSVPEMRKFIEGFD
jgi:hypothetical protein